MFMGQYEHSIDAKGRAIVPAKYREELGDVFYVTWGVDGCLYLYPQSDWEETAESAIQSAEPSDPETVNGISVRADLGQAGQDPDSRKASKKCQTGKGSCLCWNDQPCGDLGQGDL